MDLKFSIVPHDSSAWRQAVGLREVVLRKPLGSFFSQEELEAEKDHIHVVGFIGNDLIATAVLIPEGPHLKMQRVAVRDAYRNRLIGSKMMAFCESFAKTEGYQTIYCHARDTAVNFYLKNNYLNVGNYFEEDGIPHVKMTRDI